ncbi:MAG: hypothetical protein NVS9B1_13710 [Candidatus Dormibacteraceae bacterium]
MAENIRDANDAIWNAYRQARRDAAERRRYPALIQALDDLLFELEELNVQGVVRVPAELREQAGQVLELVPAPDPETIRIRYRVQAMMDTLFRAQELVFRARDPQRPVFSDEEDNLTA